MNGARFDLLVSGSTQPLGPHGALGWSSVGLLRLEGHVALFDTGAFGYREPLISSLADFGLEPDDVTEVLLTHAHWDHVCNYPLFPRARVFIGQSELEWASALPADDVHVPELYLRDLTSRARLTIVSDGDEPLDRVRVLTTPGHTPGHISYLIRAVPGAVLFAGDAVKNATELKTGVARMTFDAAASRASIQRLKDIARTHDATIVPGHDDAVKK